MSDQGTASGVNWRGYILRSAVAAAVLIVGVFAISHTIGYRLRSSNPSLASTIAPFDGRVLALLAARHSDESASIFERHLADQLAREALMRDPTAVVAASTLGLNAQVRNDMVKTRVSFAYAEQLSRRDIQTQLWAIEDAVSRNDVTGALLHYDVALRTHPRMFEFLFPILGVASTDPEIVPSLIRTLARRPVWGEAFVNHLSYSSPDPVASAFLFQKLRRVGVVVPRDAMARNIDNIIAAQRPEIAWVAYLALHPKTDRTRSRDPRFARPVEGGTQFDWRVPEVNGVNAYIAQAEGNGSFEVTVPASVGGTVLQQVQLLPPGRYRLVGQGENIDRFLSARPYWQLRCLNGVELGRIVLQPASSEQVRFDGRFVVPVKCPAQVLALIVEPTDAVSGISGRIVFAQMGRTQ